MTINDKIVEVAERFEFLVEVKSNAEWDDPKTIGKDLRAKDLEKMLKRAGHQDGWPYCMSYCEGVWLTAYEEIKSSAASIKLIQDLLTPSVMESFSRCKEKGLITQTPHKGAIGFMQLRNKWQGHAFIVDRVVGTTIYTIEANTSPSAEDSAADRDGGIRTGGIWRKRRLLSFKQNGGLWLRGFLNPV